MLLIVSCRGLVDGFVYAVTSRNVLANVPCDRYCIYLYLFVFFFAGGKRSCEPLATTTKVVVKFPQGSDSKIHRSETWSLADY